MNRTFRRSLTALAAIALAAAAHAAQISSATTTRASSPPSTPDAAHLELALRKLTVVGRALYVAAHPDDENTAMLAWLANDKLVRTGYLSLTRGDGGQNLIGTEKGDLLGVIRTQELLAARHIDGAEQFFSRAIDFGYSKNPEETLSIWGHDAVLADVVWVIRLFRPDVIITRFPTTGEGGHGHHTASAILAGEAFAAAGDPSRFPEQLAYVSPWKPKRLLWNIFRFPGVPPPATPPGKLVTVDLGSYNELLGKSYTEIAGDSRSMHKSQGFGAPERRGTMTNDFVMIAGDPPTGNDLFEGVDLTWTRIPGGERVGAFLGQALQSYDPGRRETVIPALLQALAALDQLKPADPVTADTIAIKRGEILDAIRAAAGLWIEAISEQPSATPNGAAKITATVVNRSPFPLRLARISAGGVEVSPAKDLPNNESVSQTFAVKLDGAAWTQPYWLREPPSKGLFTVNDQTLVGQPQNPSALAVRVEIAAGDQMLAFEVPALYRWTDRVAGEQYRPFEVVPEVTVNLDQKVYLFPAPGAKTVHVLLRSGADDVKGALRLALPAGWKSEPASGPFALAKKGDEQTIAFTVNSPASGSSTGELRAEATTAAGTYSRSIVTIDYPHIPEQTLFPPAASRLLRVDVKKKGKSIGYVMGPGDEVPQSLREIGYDVTLLSDDQLERGDLSKYDAIVVGVRAYNTREKLRQQHARLMDYVKNGGTVVVQYQTVDSTLAPQIGPWPLKLSRGRVTVEEAPVTVLAPDAQVLNSPNRITQADFEGWVQERGLYFAGEWDPQYQAAIASHDPGEKDLPGGLLVGHYGKGKYVFTGYAFFRQLPAGVPGAYRLFANLVAPVR